MSLVLEDNLRIIGTTPRNNHCDTSFVGKIQSGVVSKGTTNATYLAAAEGVAPQFDPCEW